MIDKGPLFIRWNGPVYWLHISFGRVFSLTIGEKEGA